MGKAELKKELRGKFTQLSTIRSKPLLSDSDVKVALELIEQSEKLIDQLEYRGVEGIKRSQSRLLNSFYKLEDQIGINNLIKIIRFMEKKTKEVAQGIHDKQLERSNFDHRLFLKPVFGKLNFSRAVVEEIKKLKPVESDVDVLKVRRSLITLFLNVEFNFKEFYRLRSALRDLATNIKKRVNEELQAEVTVEFKHLSVKVARFEEDLESQVTFVYRKLAHILHLLVYAQRFELMKKKIEPLFKEQEVNLKKIVGRTLHLKEVQFIKAKSLKINYKSPGKSFVTESKPLLKDPLFVRRSSELQIRRCIKVLTTLIQLIKREYLHKCDSPYHGLEHASQVVITSLRIFLKYQKLHRLGLVEFFKLIAAAVLHDTGYFSEHFRHSCPGYLSSMNHVGHEQRSAQYAITYLNQFKAEIESLGLGVSFNDLIGSIQNIISSTSIFGEADDPTRDRNLQSIIRAADLLEMCSERYINYLIPFYKENKLGNPQGPWPKDLRELLGGTPFFMTQLDLVIDRVGPLEKYQPEDPKKRPKMKYRNQGDDPDDKSMMKYLIGYPNYRWNRLAISQNMTKFIKILNEEKKTEEQIAVEVRGKRRAAA